MDSSSHGVGSSQLPGSSISLPLPGSRQNPIDLTSSTTTTAPALLREYVDLSSSPSAARPNAYPSASAITPPVTASYLEGLSRSRSNTRGRYRRPSSNTFSSRYPPGDLPPAVPSRPHSLSSPSPMAASSSPGLPQGTRPPAYGPGYPVANNRASYPIFSPLGDQGGWEPSNWAGPSPYRPPRTFNELLPSTTSTPALDGEGSEASRRAVWQPDEDATACTRCSREFGLLVRRHHCRKCGLVVCANCSTHRISMPRKYVAQPAELDTENEPENGDELQTARVCDPCVPDPNWGPPPQQPYSSTFPRSPPQIPPRLSQRMAARPSHRPVPVPFEPPIAGPSTQLEGPPPSDWPSSWAHATPSNPTRHYHRMATYVASEKDVRSQNDELQECVICLEEFEVGVELALLECFCKFHKNCIVEWWDKDAAGSCPTHKLRE